MTNPNISSSYKDAYLSNLSYANKVSLNGGPAGDDDSNASEIVANLIFQNKTPDGTVIETYTVLAVSSNDSSGYKAYAFQDSSGKIIIANRGTEFSGTNDLYADAQIGLDILPNQVHEAVAFTNQVAALVKTTNPDFTVSDIHQTGHSLGGGIAQLMALMTNSTATTFNAPPVGHLADNLYVEYPEQFLSSPTNFSSFQDKIFDIVEKDDAVHDLNPFTDDQQIGTRITIDTPNVANSLLLQAVSSLNIGAAIAMNLVNSLDAHRMNYLYNISLSQKNGDQTILTQEEASYHSYLQEFTDTIKETLNNLLQDSQSISPSLQSYLNFMFSSESIHEGRGPIDPLTLDLGGDGVELVNVNNSTAFFDLDVVANADGSYTSDGQKEQVGWVGASDGILALDKNHNGKIDNIIELFGKSNKTGTEELREYDLNSDGKIDANDAVFSQLKVWQDLNQDGISQSCELKTLSQLNISSISVSNDSLKSVNQNIEGWWTEKLNEVESFFR